MDQRHSFAAWTIALHNATSGQVRWETGTIASMLLDCTVTLQPTSADDQVALSEFLEQVQSGNVEMEHVQRDNSDEQRPLTAQAELVAEIVREILSTLSGDATMAFDGGGAAATSGEQSPPDRRSRDHSSPNLQSSSGGEHPGAAAAAAGILPVGCKRGKA